MLRLLAGFSALRLASFAALSALVCQVPCFGQEDDYLGERPERNAMVRVVEGRVKIVKWDYEEELTVGMPVAEGDVIQSDGRGVIQLGDGTRIAFGDRAKLDVATLFDYSDGGAQALFRLASGRARLSVGSQSGANIRIDTVYGSATLGARSNAYIEVGMDRSLNLRVFSGSVAFRNKVDAVSVMAGDCLTAFSDNDRLDRARPFNTYQLNSFEAWAERYLAPGQQVSRHVPREIRYYADSLDGYGDWVEIVDVGWCWRPRLTVAGWRPYWRGHWGPYRGGMTWVSYDPFGYVTHHYGRWGWNGVYGWYWIPGVYYSPAWVAWNIVDTLFGWAPLGYYNRPVYWGYNGWNHDCWIVVDYRHIHSRNIYNYSRWDNNIGKLFPAHQPNRGLTPAWRQGPLVVTRNEFNRPDKGQLRAALSKDVSAQRLSAYEAQVGRQTIVRREKTTGGESNAVAGELTAKGRPFEDRTTRRAVEDRSVLREPTGRPQREGVERSGGERNDRSTTTEIRRSVQVSGEPSRNQEGRRPDAPPPSRSYEMREPDRAPAPRPSETREYNRPAAPPSRGYEPREPSRTDAPPSRTSEPSRTAEPVRTSPPPSSPVHYSSPRPAPPPSSNSSHSAPPPDRSRNSRR